MDPELIPLLPAKKHLYYTNGLVLIIAAMLVITAWNISKRSWQDLGIRWPEINKMVIIGIIAVVVLYLANLLYSLLVKSYSERKTKELSYIIPMNFSEYKHFIFIAFAAGISEEIIYRGFAIPYLMHFDNLLGGSAIVAIILTAFVFALGHLYQGWWDTLKIFGIAIFFGIIFWYSGSLLIVIIIHILVDLISGLSGIINGGDSSDNHNENTEIHVEIRQDIFEDSTDNN